MSAKRATTPTPTPIPVPAHVETEKTKQEGLQIVQPLQLACEELTIETDDDYLAADGLLSRVRHARKSWGDRLEKIIRPIRTGLDELYALDRSVDKPLGALEDGIKAKMKAFKLAELKLLQEAEQRKQEEAARLQREAEEKAAAAARATTPQLRGRLQAQAVKAGAAAVAVAQQELPQPVRGESSTTRPLQKVRVSNILHFLQGVIDGYVPEDCITDAKVMERIQSMLNIYFKEDPEGMKAWPGVEVYDDIQIVGR